MKTFQNFITEARKAKRKYSVDIEAEKGEFERYPDSEKLMQRARASSVRKLSNKEVGKLSNSDVPEIKPGAKGRRKARRLARSYGRDIKRVNQQIKNKTDQPVIVKKTDSGHELIAGNTRAMARRALNKPVHALVVQ